MTCLHFSIMSHLKIELCLISGCSSLLHLFHWSVSMRSWSVPRVIDRASCRSEGHAASAEQRSNPANIPAQHAGSSNAGFSLKGLLEETELTSRLNLSSRPFLYTLLSYMFAKNFTDVRWVQQRIWTVYRTKSKLYNNIFLGYSLHIQVSLISQHLMYTAKHNNAAVSV